MNSPQIAIIGCNRYNMVNDKRNQVISPDLDHSLSFWWAESIEKNGTAHEKILMPQTLRELYPLLPQSFLNFFLKNIFNIM